MKKGAYLINTFFVILFSKSVVFANELESEINYLVELGRSNISQANSLMSLLRLLIALFTLAFVTVLAFLIIKLIELANQIKANKEVLQTIEKHGKSISILARDTEEIRNQIRDQSLMVKGITDVDYGKFIEEVLKWKPTPSHINMVKTLVWTLFKPDEYESGLKTLRKVFAEDTVPALMALIIRSYTKTFRQSIPRRKLLTWVYEMKEKNKKLDDLLSEERQAIIDYQKGMREYYESLPPLYPGRKPSRLQQILMREVSKKKESGE